MKRQIPSAIGISSVIVVLLIAPHGWWTVAGLATVAYAARRAAGIRQEVASLREWAARDGRALLNALPYEEYFDELDDPLFAHHVFQALYGRERQLVEDVAAAVVSALNSRDSDASRTKWWRRLLSR
jgi:hypothetical protein